MSLCVIYEFNDKNKKNVKLAASSFMFFESSDTLKIINNVTKNELIIKGNKYILNVLSINLENGVSFDVLANLFKQIDNGTELYNHMIGGFFVE